MATVAIVKRNGDLSGIEIKCYFTPPAALRLIKPYNRLSILRLVFSYSIAARLAQLDKSLSAKREASGSHSGRTNTKGPKINEDNVLSTL